ncbi:hypothetical protein D8682_01070 (plasmid) [Buttiauxella sp. 3AFRM03]|uniref:hypothetical protein n=1 Tax=Buttiauxella sp. 3AFRM03 TaxID=2479367 RepID=UPI000EF84859|nr:hypothetical protein [Buttiauxella sp. 3AFRM03]AYN25662.1 hypothetical protein D8682_00840 [Buttiauxella sp. 3AFRM03]AYN25703.1 hypothetical protein D8682_01070 [Buttiauxella sp. 3AFRM03]
MKNTGNSLSSLEWFFAHAKAGSLSAQVQLKSFPVSDVEKVTELWESDPAYRERLQHERRRGE